MPMTCKSKDKIREKAKSKKKYQPPELLYIVTEDAGKFSWQTIFVLTHLEN